MTGDQMFWLGVGAIVVLFLVGITWASGMQKAAKPGRRGNDEAKAILENRYALGEIDDEEFAHRMTVLSEERVRYRKKTLGKLEV